jgi:hypothetical protein
MYKIFKSLLEQKTKELDPSILFQIATDDEYNEIDYSDDPYLKDLIANGKLFIPVNESENKEAIDEVCDNQNGFCHQAISDLYIHNKQDGDKLYTGYCLNQYNNEWFQHTFIINSKNGIVEPTSVLHNAYFGFELKNNKLEEFLRVWSD